MSRRKNIGVGRAKNRDLETDAMIEKEKGGWNRKVRD